MQTDQQPKRHVSRNGTKRRRGGETKIKLHRQSLENNKPSDFEGQVIYDPDSDERGYFSIKSRPTSTVLPLIKLDKGPRGFLTPSSFE